MDDHRIVGSSYFEVDSKIVGPVAIENLALFLDTTKFLVRSTLVDQLQIFRAYLKLVEKLQLGWGRQLRNFCSTDFVEYYLEQISYLSIYKNDSIYFTTLAVIRISGPTRSTVRSSRSAITSFTGITVVGPPPMIGAI